MIQYRFQEKGIRNSSNKNRAPLLWKKSSLYVEMWSILQCVLSERGQTQNNVDAVPNTYMKEGDQCLWMHVP